MFSCLREAEYDSEMNNSRCSTFYIALPTSAADKEYFSLIHHSGHLFFNSKEGEKYSTPFCCSMRLQVILEYPIMVFLNLDFPSFLPLPLFFLFKTGMHAKSLQSCLVLCDPMDCSPPGSSVHGILQARILEWVDIPSSRGSSPPRD